MGHLKQCNLIRVPEKSNEKRGNQFEKGGSGEKEERERT